MNSIYRCKNLGFLPLVTVGVFLASTFFFLSLAMAAEEAQIEAAIEDLGLAIGQDITSEEQAKTFCNQEQYLDVCADIGKKHGLYAAEELKQVDSFLSEVKGKILEDIKTCQDEECLIRVAGELANKIKAKNPTLADDFKLTSVLIEEKNNIVQAAKEVGVNFRDCEALDPDTAPVDLLRKCARLAKDSRVQKYIPEERRVLADQFGDTTIKLREALSAGQYQCGDGTLEGCGNYCLNPSATTQTAGIPEVCRQIATEIFGPEGVKELESAHRQVGQVKDYYSKKFILILPDGKELAGEGQIRSVCDQAFSGRNLEVARACGSFAVNNGFVSQAEVDKGLKLLESFVQRGQNINFDQCLNNPTSCRDFIPEEERGRFDAGSQIFEIMRTEIGFDPSQCERGAIDQVIGTKCLEGSKRALAKIEGLGLAKQSREAQFIIEDIKRHVTEGENLGQRGDQFKQVFSQQGGPGGCKSQTECFTYCSNPTNGPECIAFGSQQGVSGFRGQEAVQKFQEYNQNLQRPGLTSNEYRGQFSQFPGQGSYPGFQPLGQGGFPPGQVPGFSQPGPGFYSPPGQGGFYPGPGPSPECFAAIQSGDFVKAKTVCTTSIHIEPTGQPPICPASPYIECPVGQYRESFRNNDGCWVDGPCRPAPTYSSGPYPTESYPSCPAGQWWDGATQSCRPSSGSYTPYPSYACPSGQWWDYTYNKCTSAPACGPGYYWDSATNACKLSGSSTCSQSLINLLGQGCHQMFLDSSGINVYCDGAMTKSAKEGDTVTTAGCTGGGYTYTPYPTSSGSYTPPPTCPTGSYWDYAQNKCSTSSCSSGYYWDSATSTCKPNTSSGSCPSGSHTMYVNNPGDYCMSDSDLTKCGPLNSSSTSSFGSCSSYQSTSTSPYPTYSSGNSACSPSLTNLLGTGCHSMYTDSAGRSIFCDGPMSKSAKEGDTVTTAGCTGGGTATTYTPYPSCPSGQWWDTAQSRCTSTATSCATGYYWDSVSNICKPNSSTSYTPYPTTSPSSGSCPSGAHSMGSYCMSDSDGSKCGPTGSTSTSSFGSCSAYQNTTTSCGTGYYWDSATNACKSTCPSTQYWNGSSCVDAPTNYITPSTTTYAPPPSYSPASTYTSTYTPPSCGTGYYWDSATSVCKSTCPSTQYWNGSSCVDNATPPPATTYTPYPTTSYSPPPTVFDVRAHQMAVANTIMACSRSGGQWDSGRLVCMAQKSGFLANILRVFSKFMIGR